MYIHVDNNLDLFDLHGSLELSVLLLLVGGVGPASNTYRQIIIWMSVNYKSEVMSCSTHVHAYGGQFQCVTFSNIITLHQINDAYKFMPLRPPWTPRHPGHAGHPGTLDIMDTLGTMDTLGALVPWVPMGTIGTIGTLGTKGTTGTMNTWAPWHHGHHGHVFPQVVGHKTAS